MHRTIILNFPPKLSKEEKNRLTELVNSKLISIAPEINSWSGFVDVLKADALQYSYIGKCDNEDVRIKMQDLLDQI